MREHGTARRLPMVAVALLAASLSAAGSGAVVLAPGSERPASRAPAAGVVWHGMWSSWDPGERGRTLDAMAAHDLGWVRLDVGWASLQPDGPGRLDPYELARVRSAVGMARSRGLKVLVMFWLTPAWAGPQLRAAPDDSRDYAAALGELAAAVPAVEAWEVWNEPNDADFFASADPADYARLLGAAHDALRRSAPRDQVVMGGTSYNDAAWIEKALAAGAAGRYDVMATHPYGAPADRPATAADDGTRYSFGHLRMVLAAMARHGDAGRPVWLTEVGWSTHRDAPGAPPWERGVDEAAQAERSARLLTLCAERFPAVEAVFFYTAVDHRTGTRSQYDNYGLLRDDLSAKPVLDAIAAVER